MDSRMNYLPGLLELTEIGPGRYRVFRPASSAEGRDVVFSGQYLAQMLMASEKAAGGAKSPRSIHAVHRLRGDQGGGRAGIWRRSGPCDRTETKSTLVLLKGGYQLDGQGGGGRTGSGPVDVDLRRI